MSDVDVQDLVGRHVRIVDAKSRRSLDAYDGETGIVCWAFVENYSGLVVRLDGDMTVAAPLEGADAVIVEPA